MYSYSYTYYDDGKLETEKHIVAGATEQPVIKYTYDNNGNVVSKVLSNSSNENDVKVTSSYSYNLANECVTEVHNNGTGYNYEYSYTYTPDGNVLESSLIKREKRIKTIYTYDRLNRLTSEEQQEYNKGDLSGEFKDVYSFDDYNNILQKIHTENDTTKNSTVVSTYDKTRLLTQTETDSENNQSSKITYTYDDNGNMSSKVFVKSENTTETQLSYDGFDRTTGIKIGDVTTSFDYNTDSDRVSKTTNGKTTESILDNDSVSADLIGETLKVFTEDNSVFCQNGVFSYNVINTKGDIIASDGSNNIAYNYNAYGTELYNCSSANPIGYRNYYYDSETGLYYLKARYYDPTTGQFTQEDTVQDDNLQYNLYGYCSANPVLYTDPSGHNAVLMISNKSAGSGPVYFGHIAVLLQYVGNTWYYCSIDGKGSSGNKKNPVTYRKVVKKIDTHTTISTINSLLGREKKEVYNEKIHFKGDFKKSITYFEKNYYKNKKYKYDLFSNNCSQISFRTLGRGYFSIYHNDYIYVVNRLSTMTIPKSAFNAMRHFNRYFPAYKNASTKEKKKIWYSNKNPYLFVPR